MEEEIKIMEEGKNEDETKEKRDAGGEDIRDKMEENKEIDDSEEKTEGGEKTTRKEEIKIEQYGNIKVFYNDRLNGGGNFFGQQFVPVVKKRFGKVNRLLEFCGGPGFIGFSLLAQGLCNEVVFVDINLEVIDILNKTIQENNLQTVARVYLSDGLRRLPIEEKFDLIISNPPHFRTSQKLGLIGFDEDWKLHDSFYKNVDKYLNERGSILFQENYLGSDEGDFIDMIKKNGLTYSESFMYREEIDCKVATFYFIHAKKPLRVQISKDNGENEDKMPQISLNSHEIYELILESDGELRTDLILSNLERTFFNVVPFVKVREGEKEFKTCKFYLTRGKFELIDQETKKSYLKINVD